MHDDNINKEGHIKHRVITLLDRQELEFLDKLGKDALFATGHKLSHNEILKVLVEMAMNMEVSWESLDAMKSMLFEKPADEKDQEGEEK